MKSIWKVNLAVADQQLVHLPEGAEVLSVQVQGGVPTVWFKCDTEREPVGRTFFMYGTGHQLPEEPGRFIGTFQLHGGALVFHLFEREGR